MRSFAYALSRLPSIKFIEILFKIDPQFRSTPIWLSSFTQVKPIIGKYIIKAFVVPILHQSIQPFAKDKMEQTNSFMYERTALNSNQCNIISQLPKVQEWKCEALQFKNYPHIILGIRNINFYSLKQLFLCDNCITTIEPLSILNAPILTQINVGFNYITCMDSLAKLLSQEIHYFDISHNYLREVGKFVNRSWAKCGKIFLQSPSSAQCQSVRDLVHMNVKSGRSLIRINSNRRILNSNLNVIGKNRKVSFLTQNGLIEEKLN